MKPLYFQVVLTNLYVIFWFFMTMAICFCTDTQKTAFLII